MNNANSKKPFFYGWVIVAACMLIQAVPFGIAANVQPQFTSFVMKGEGFSLTQFSLVFTLGTIVSAVCSPFIGNLFSKPKLNVKLFYVLGGILSGGGFLLFSFAKGNIYAYYGISALVQVGTAIISAIGVPMLVNSWFKENKGMAMGLAFSGGGLGNIFLQQIAAKLLNNPEIGYQGAYFIFGIISIVVSVPVALLLIRLPKSPSELEANVPKAKKNDSSPVKAATSWGYSFAEVKSMKLFWLFAIGFVFVGLYVGGMSLQFMPYFYDLGLSGQFVANVGSIFALLSIFGNLFGGLLFDKLGITKSLLLAGTLVIMCAVCLIFTPQVNVLGYVFAVGLGISMFAYIIGPSYLTGALFGDKEFGTILGIVQIFFATGFALGSSVFGVIVDNTSFTTAWIITGVFAAIAYGLLLVSTAKIIKFNKDNDVTETKKIA
ncbi:MAG: conjugated bile salt MFS transporter [Romboutsia sp.]